MNNLWGTFINLLNCYSQPRYTKSKYNFESEGQRFSAISVLIFNICAFFHMSIYRHFVIFHTLFLTMLMFFCVLVGLFISNDLIQEEAWTLITPSSKCPATKILQPLMRWWQWGWMMRSTFHWYQDLERFFLLNCEFWSQWIWLVVGFKRNCDGLAMINDK